MRGADELCSSLVDDMTVPHSADGSEASFCAEGALKVPATASVAWVRSAANHEGIVGYTNPTIRRRGGGRMASAAQCRTVPQVHGWGAAWGAAHRAYGRQDRTELAETDLRVLRQLNANDCMSFSVEGSLHHRGALRELPSERLDDLPQMADSNRFGQIFGRTRKSRLIRIPKERRSDYSGATP